MDYKTMDLDEFMQVGLLQEINRKFLHPMGLALSVSVNKESGKVEGFGPIWDFRDDPEGMRFEDYVISKDKVDRVEKMFVAKKEVREKVLGYHVQPSEKITPAKISE